MTAPHLIAGIDPGLDGALVLYDPSHAEPPKVYDMPTYDITTNGKRKCQLNLYELARILDVHAPTVKSAVIEEPAAMPGQGVSSMFKFGFNCGVAQAIVAAHFIPTKLTRPSAWKKAMGLTSDKDASRKLASQMMPQHARLWARVKDDGRAEALLLAIWGSRQ